jgi:hypothetical protein
LTYVFQKQVFMDTVEYLKRKALEISEGRNTASYLCYFSSISNSCLFYESTENVIILNLPFYTAHSVRFLLILRDIHSIIIDISTLSIIIGEIKKQSNLLDCYAYVVTCFFSLTSYLRRNTACLNYEE